MDTYNQTTNQTTKQTTKMAMYGLNALYMFKDRWYNNYLNYMYTTTSISRNNNYPLCYAIISYINIIDPNKKIFNYNIISEGHRLTYDVANGNYILYNEINSDGTIDINNITRNYHNNHLYIEITDEHFIFHISSNVSFDTLKNYLNNIYDTFYTPQNQLTFYQSNKNIWLTPIVRIPRNINQMNITQSMQNVIDDVQQFRDSRQLYRTRQNPYKRGYMLKGLPGTGKSVMIEYIAIKYNMIVYQVNLVSHEMADADLIQLLANIPPNSLVVFEEFEKQVETLMEHNTLVSHAGILTAIDGCARLNDNIIVIMTSNVNLNLPKGLLPLFRPGRIDQTFILQEQFNAV